MYQYRIFLCYPRRFLCDENNSPSLLEVNIMYNMLEMLQVRIIHYEQTSSNGCNYGRKEKIAFNLFYEG